MKTMNTNYSLPVTLTLPAHSGELRLISGVLEELELQNKTIGECNTAWPQSDCIVTELTRWKAHSDKVSSNSNIQTTARPLSTAGIH